MTTTKSMPRKDSEIILGLQETQRIAACIRWKVKKCAPSWARSCRIRVIKRGPDAPNIVRLIDPKPSWYNSTWLVEFFPRVTEGLIKLKSIPDKHPVWNW